MLLTVIWELFAVRTKNNKTRLLFPFSQRFSSACLTLTYPRHTDAHQLIFSLHPPAPLPPTPPPPIFPSPYFTFLTHSYILHTAVISARRYTRPDSPPAVTGTRHFLMDVEAATRVLPLPSSPVHLTSLIFPFPSPSSQASCAEILYNLCLSVCLFIFVSLQAVSTRLQVFRRSWEVLCLIS